MVYTLIAHKKANCNNIKFVTISDNHLLHPVSQEKYYVFLQKNKILKKILKIFIKKVLHFKFVHV